MVVGWLWIYLIDFIQFLVAQIELILHELDTNVRDRLHDLDGVLGILSGSPLATESKQVDKGNQDHQRDDSCETVIQPFTNRHLNQPSMFEITAAY